MSDTNRPDFAHGDKVVYRRTGREVLRYMYPYTDGIVKGFEYVRPAIPGDAFLVEGVFGTVAEACAKWGALLISEWQMPLVEVINGEGTLVAPAGCFEKSEVPGTHRCTCDIMVVMRMGCQCGGT